MFSWIGDELDRLRGEHLLRTRRVVTPLGQGRCRLGDSANAFLDFSSNDYLDLATDPRLRDAVRAALEELGTGARSSALVSGVHPLHERLREAIAEFEHTESAILFPTGYAANQGAIGALVDSSDAVYCDRFNHASLVDGGRLSGAKFRIYRHDDLDSLRRVLTRDKGARRRLIVTDGLFSMDGDIAPLPELFEISRKFEAMLLVDEAHATGVLGGQGRGSVELCGLEEQPIIRVGTLSKAIGSLGGFVAGPASLVELLWNKARTQIYSTALPPAVCAAAIAGLRLIREEPERRRKLEELARECRARLAAADIRPLNDGPGPIIPIVLHDPELAVRAAAELERRGILVAAIRPPTVPRGTSRLRISLSCGHSVDDIHILTESLVDVLQSA